MIAFLRGEVAGRTATDALVDVGGVGYCVHMGARQLAQLPEVGQPVKVLTYMQVSDAGMALYGFLEDSERQLFLQLLQVSGVGPKVACAVLGHYAAEELAHAIATEDVNMVAKVPGVGKKTAQRIILELKGSLESFDAVGMAPLFGGRGVTAAPKKVSAAEAVTAALLSMGFTGREAELALQGAPEDGSESALLKYALKKLGS